MFMFIQGTAKTENKKIRIKPLILKVSMHVCFHYDKDSENLFQSAMNSVTENLFQTSKMSVTA